MHGKIANICNCIAWSNDGKSLYSGYSNNKIIVWKLISPFDDDVKGFHANVDINAEQELREEETQLSEPVQRVMELTFEINKTTSVQSAL